MSSIDLEDTVLLAHTDQGNDCNKGIFVRVTITSMGEVLVTGAGKQE